MIDVRFRPLSDPNETRERRKSRERSRFKATYKQTLDLLEYELNHLRAKDIVIQAGYALSQIRNDGWPYANAKASHPAVVLSYRNRKNEEVSFPCDSYDQMEDNLRAIGLTLKSLRDIDRYGVSQGGEQYKGWTALPEAGKSDTTREAAAILATFSPALSVDLILSDPGAMQEAYRQAAKRCHPDAGGSAEEWYRVEQAKRTLESNFRAGGKC